MKNIPFQGQCSFRQYLSNKPKRYVIKVFAMVDSMTFYLSKFEIYACMYPDGVYKVPTEVVQRSIEPIKNNGRNVSTDYCYTSIPLAMSLLKSN